MRRAGMLALAALCSCGIDARTVAVPPRCDSPPADGLLSDFSTAHLGVCDGPPCPDALAGSTTVSLGTGSVSGLVFLTEQVAASATALTLTGDLQKVSDETSALRVVLSYDSLAHDVPPRAGAFALELPPCLDVSAYAGISFVAAGSLGTCPLHAAALFRDVGAGPPSATCPLGDCLPAQDVVAGAGLAMVPFPDPVGAEAAAALVGVRWQLALPVDGARTCDADFTLDDLRLVARAAAP